MNNSIFCCAIVLGNLSTLETDKMKDNIVHFLKSFNYTDSEPEKFMKRTEVLYIIMRLK